MALRHVHVHSDFAASYTSYVSLSEWQTSHLYMSKVLSQMMIEVYKVYHSIGPVCMEHLLTR